MSKPRAHMALGNVESFQYLMCKRYLKTKSGPEQKLRALNFLIARAQMAHVWFISTVIPVDCFVAKPSKR